MLRTDLVPARDLRHHRARRKRLRNDPPLLGVAPAPPATNATANLDAPARPRSVNYMVDHVCEPISSTGLASSRLRRAPQDGVKTPLTDHAPSPQTVVPGYRQSARSQGEARARLCRNDQWQTEIVLPARLCAGIEPGRVGMEPHETHRYCQASACLKRIAAGPHRGRP